MSGGVDSSVTAALLHAEGYDVVGITLQLYDHGMAVAKKGACCAGQDIHDARQVAERLGIPHYVLDYESRFRDAVIDDFADSYLRGETPIPCVNCNQTVKFRDLLATARDLGADALATGHYVQRRLGPDGAELHRAVDPRRDQSYFLFATTREQLDFLRFPLGGLAQGRDAPRGRALRPVVADKPDSQDICFVPQGSYARWWRSCAPARPSPARSCTSTAACSAATRASSTSPSASAAASASAARASRCSWCGWSRRRAAWWSARRSSSAG
jgi:tRNA-uridine 2-sulfurtransferase